MVVSYRGPGGRGKRALWVRKCLVMERLFPSPVLKPSENCGYGSRNTERCREDRVMPERPGGRAGESCDAFEGLDFRLCSRLALRFRHLLGVSHLSESCRSTTRGAETRAEIFMRDPAPTDTSLQPEEVLTLCCCLLFAYSCDGWRKTGSLPSPSPGVDVNASPGERLRARLCFKPGCSTRAWGGGTCRALWAESWHVAG